MVYSGAWGKPINEKNKKSQISWHCFFKAAAMLICIELGYPMEKSAETLRYPSS